MGRLVQVLRAHGEASRRLSWGPFDKPAGLAETLAGFVPLEERRDGGLAGYPEHRAGRVCAFVDQLAA
jgi:hypothetical protein